MLDTCTFLWLAEDAPQLSKTAKEIFEEPENEIFLSVVSAWEITVKYSAGKLALPKPPHEILPYWRSLRGIESLALAEPAAVGELKLPKLHRDPFDRMLICQAIAEGITILTPDPLITQYPVNTAW